MYIPSKFRLLGLLLGIAFAVSRSVDLSAAASDYSIAQSPLYVQSPESPLMMMVMSRDEQLFNKAYSDYTDLNEDGKLDTTYQDTFEYSGYFDSSLCYTYSSGRFKAAQQATGPTPSTDPDYPKGNHKCSLKWSGNFLNWVTMSRLDILRFVLYGGKRSTDAATTVLERASIPNDLHAWVKVYAGSDIASFTPLTGTQSFCNASFGTGAPLMRVATGNWSEWAATALFQCATKDVAGNQADPDVPAAATDLTVRVEVCDPTAASTLQENFCRRYTSGTTDSYKPTGVLQKYGEDGSVRFGLMTGSYSAPRSGGVLRRNIGKLAGNTAGTNCAAGDEIDLSNGRFCTAGTESVIRTIDSFTIANQWAGSNWADCNNWGLLNRQGFSDGNGNINNPGSGGQNCSAWGNPLSEMYAEAVRYITNAGKTNGFNVSGDLAGLTAPAWTDPYRSTAGGNSYCAKCSILVMSSGLNSFDSDEIPATAAIGSAAATTHNVGVNEGVSGNYLVGRIVGSQTDLAVGNSVNTHSDICTAKDTGGNLEDVRGICPDIPSMEGSYLMSGLAHKAWTTDLRPGLQSKPSTYKNVVKTYGVAMAESLPKFEIPVGSGQLTLAPLCQSNKAGTATIPSSGWRSCYLGSVGVGAKVSSVSPNHVYGRSVQYDASNKTTAGSFSLVWEDSLWGNDHDNDVVSMLTYCVGPSCQDKTNPVNTTTEKDICWRSDSPVCSTGTPSVASNEVLVRIENLSAYAGNAMLSGFSITGSNADNVYRLALRPGSSDGSVLTSTANPRADWFKPKVLKFTVGASSAKQLQSPLWYAAKYGSFQDKDGNSVPGSGEWDTNTAGTPDNYFLARDPSKLKAALDKIIGDAAGGAGPSGGGAAGARLNSGSFTIQSSFNVPKGSNDWTGNLKGISVDSATGADIAVLWDAASKLPATRNIRMVKTPTQVNGSGAVTSAVVPKDFQATDLSYAALGLTSGKPSWMNSGDDLTTLVAYLRGNQSREQTAGSFRKRSSILGDIINSSPTIVTPKDDYGYGFWSVSSDTTIKSYGTSYKTFLASKTGSPMVYVGANDGMLHGFDATAGSSGGVEKFAFIPAGSRDHLGELANPNYVHQYYMDGAIAVADAAFSSSNWRTVLVASTGAGGAGVSGHTGSVSALDVTNPASFTDSSVLWELNGATDNDFGYVLGKPMIVPMLFNDGTGLRPHWVAIFGNGSNSANGAPVLYVVDIATGRIYARLKPSGAGYAVKNGLMGIAPVDLVGNDGMVDTVYGGDLQGNVWKFNLSSNAFASWTVALGGAPLFTAKDGNNIAQPITGGVEVSRGPGGGISVFFGTGRYFVNGDNNVPATPPVQSLYGLWDRCGSNFTCTSTITGARTSILQEQTITAGLSAGLFDIRNVSQNPVNYAVKRGWFIDLKVGAAGDGERFFGTPRLQNGKVFFTTYTPKGDSCEPGGINWLYGLNLLTGGGAMSGLSTAPGGSPVCTDCGGITLNKRDQRGPPVKETSVLLPQPTSTLSCPSTDPTCSTASNLADALAKKQCTLVLRAAGADPLYLPRPCGRQSWRQVR